jgi:hypothetical protein
MTSSSAKAPAEASHRHSGTARTSVFAVPIQNQSNEQTIASFRIIRNLQSIAELSDRKVVHIMKIGASLHAAPGPLMN